MTVAALAVTRLSLTRFRNYASQRLDPDRRPVVLVGPNGAGKTNLLEALSFLAPGRGLRGVRPPEVTRVGSPEGEGWAVAATIETPTGPLEVGTGLDKDERRVARVDGRPVKSQSALTENLSVVWLTPQMDRLFQEGASGRRRFLDRLVFGFDPAHAGRLNRHEKAARDRAVLLREGSTDDAWLSGLEEQMAASGAAIAGARLSVTARLRAAAARSVGPFPAADLSVVGPIEALLASGPALAAEDATREALRAARRADAESGTTSIGPHRSDLMVRHMERGMPASLCSTGEQKALLIAITLAHIRLSQAERGVAPLVLLDEITAHLDKARREALFTELLTSGVQAWMTGTDRDEFAPLGEAARWMRVEEARVMPE